MPSRGICAECYDRHIYHKYEICEECEKYLCDYCNRLNGGQRKCKNCLI